MDIQRHRRQVLLFLLAVILPCAVLVVLGLRMVAQEGELSKKRLADDRRRVTNLLRRDLGSMLERIALQEATAVITQPDRPLLRRGEHPAVVLVAPISNGRLVLPWEQDPRVQQFRRQQKGGNYGRLIQQGERQELVQHAPARAALSYAGALRSANSPAQAAYARLLLARTARARGRQGDAVSSYRTVLDASPDAVDEHGVPLSLYAATQLLDVGTGTGNEEVLAQVGAIIDGTRWLGPSALYMIDGLANRLVEIAPDSGMRVTAEELAQGVSEYVAMSEQAMALQRDFAGLGLAVSAVTPSYQLEGTWVPYGTPAWLVGVARSLEGEPIAAVAVHADSVFSAVGRAQADSDGFTGELVLATEGMADGEMLGASFRGLGVRFPAAAGDRAAAQWGIQQWFYLLTLVLVVAVTLFGAYLLWRDVQRELRLAETRSRFVSAVSHELKTPLTAIRMFAETLQMGRSTEPEMQAEYLDTIVNETERLTRLLNNVLDFSKIEQGQKTYRFEPACLAEIVRASVRTLEYPLRQQHFELNVAVEDEMPPARVDRDAIEQAILNLLTNAMKYSGESRDIDLSLRRDDGKAVIAVTDRGVGIEPAEQDRIVEQFYRVPTKENLRIPGTGLGLTLVRHIAEAHGGRLSVESAPGRGSTFAIHLPMEQQAS